MYNQKDSAIKKVSLLILVLRAIKLILAIFSRR